MILQMMLGGLVGDGGGSAGESVCQTKCLQHIDNCVYCK